MIAVRMGIDDPRNGFVRQLLKLCQYIFGGLGAFAGVDDRDAAGTFDHMHIGCGKTHGGENPSPKRVIDFSNCARCANRSGVPSVFCNLL